jgi:hypothetical protein
MTQVRLDLNEKQNRTINIYKAKHDLKNKAEAIKRLIDECGELNENSAQTNIPSNRKRA